MAKLTNCQKCGLPWIGTDTCECGWAPDRHLVYVKGGIIALCVVVLAGFVYMSQHYWDYFPDEQKAREHTIKADDSFGRGSFIDALTEYQTAASYSPKRADLKEKLALTLLNDRRPNEALEQMRLAHQLAPSNAKISEEYCVLLEQNGRDADAAVVLETLLKNNPKDLKRFHLAELYEKTGNLPKAQAIYTEFTQSQPRTNGAWVGIARLQEHDGKHAEAVATLRKALTFMPGDAVLHQNLGIALGNDKQIDAAVKELTRSAEIAPGLAESSSLAISSLTRGAGPKEFSIPVRKQGDSYTVQATLNETVPVTLQIDSNAAGMSISPQVFTRLHLSASAGSPILLQGTNGVSVGRQVVLKSLKVGGAKEVLMPAAVLPAPHGADGLLGMSFLSRYEFSLDGSGKALVLRKH